MSVPAEVGGAALGGAVALLRAVEPVVFKSSVAGVIGIAVAADVFGVSASIAAVVVVVGEYLAQLVLSSK